MNNPLGLKRKTVVLVDHNPEWFSLFEKEKKGIQHLLGDRVLQVEHIGSTAVPNLKAKPVLDLMIAIDDINDWKWLEAPLSTLGYTFRRDSRKDQEHILFVKGPDESRTHYLKATELDSDFWNSQIAFRDALIDYPRIRQGYQALKEKLLKIYDGDRDLYTKNKREFIKKALKEVGYKGRVV